MTYIDTHVAVDLFSGDTRRLSRQAVALLDREADLRISPLVMLELEFLHEIGRIRLTASKIAQTLEQELGIKLCDAGFVETARASLRESWTRDPFDRVIVAQARMKKAKLVTRDEQMQANYSAALG